MATLGDDVTIWQPSVTRPHRRRPPPTMRAMTSSPPQGAPPPSGAGGPGVASQAKRALALLGAMVVTAMLAGLLVAGLALPGALAAGRAAEGTVGIFNELPADLAEQPLSQQSRILFSDGSLMATFYYQNRIVVPLDQMAEPMQQAIVDIEDSRFYQHGGVDPEGMGRAAIVNLARGGSAQGASTLTQQWIKNTLIEKAVSTLPASATVAERQEAALVATDSTGLSGYARKLREVKLAIAAEQKYTKPEILERYLNIADFGDGAYGVQTASRHYFDKTAAEISLVDSALLAGIVQRPGAFNPRLHPEAAQERRDVVLDRMLQLATIDQATHDEAVATPIADQLNIQPSPNGCEMAQGSGYFCDFAVRNLLADPVFGETFEDRRLKLYRGGLSITTTLDPAKQRAAEDALADRVQGNGGVSGSIVTVEPGTGRVVEMAQNSIYSTSPDAPPGATALNFNVDRQSGGGNGFQPGSNFKPVVLAAWLESGRTLSQTVNSQYKKFANSSWVYGSCPDAKNGYTSEPWGPRNAEGGSGAASMTVLQATYNSVNTAYASMENRLELCDVQEMATRLGLVNAADQSPVQPQPSMVLGVEEVAPLAVANMFATFANKGTYCRPLVLDAVSDASGEDVPITQSSCRQVIEPEVAEGVNYALENVLTRGTASSTIGPLPGHDTAGKTGTTDDSVAAWFTGYTPTLSASVWLGYADGSKSLNGARIGDRRYGRMYGGTLAAPVWERYMLRAAAGTDAPGFDRPPQRVIGTPPAPPPPPRPTTTPRRSSPAPAPAPAPRTSAPAPAPAPPPATSEPAPAPAGDGGGTGGGGTGGGEAPPVEPPPAAGDGAQPPADQG